MNMFIRSHPRFEIEADKAKAILRAAKIVASDETGVRIEGTNSYHWVFHCKDAVVHEPDYSRAARVVDEMMAGHMPEVWISDRYSAQQNHGQRHQTCLAHLARDTAFALEHGSDDLPLGSSFGWESIRFGQNHHRLRRLDPREEKTRAGKAAHASGRANRMRSRPRTASQNRPRARPTSHLLRLSRRGRRHEQYVGAQTPPDA